MSKSTCSGDGTIICRCYGDAPRDGVCAICGCVDGRADCPGCVDCEQRDEPPPEFYEAMAKDCRCCLECATVHCDGVCAGGMCDEMCRCDDAYDYAESYEDDLYDSDYEDMP